MARRPAKPTGKKSKSRIHISTSWLVPVVAMVIAVAAAFILQDGADLPGESLLDGDARLERLKPLRHRIDALVAGKEATGDAPLTYPASRFKGRGIVTAGGGRSLYSQLHVWLKALREGPHKTDIPVEIFYAGADELPQDAIAHTERQFANVTFVDATRAAEAKGVDLRGYQMKAFAVYLSSFEEVLWLDADNYPLVDAAQMFALRPSDQAALLWPDVCNMFSVRPEAWRVLRESKSCSQCDAVPLISFSCSQFSLSPWPFVSFCSATRRPPEPQEPQARHNLVGPVR